MRCTLIAMGAAPVRVLPPCEADFDEWGHRLEIYGLDLRHTPTGTTVRAFEYGAGDNSYGAIYKAGTTTRFATIVDLTYYDCAFAN